MCGFCLQELNHRLNEEITRMHSCISEDKSTSSLTQGKDIYELEVQHQLRHLSLDHIKSSCTTSKHGCAAGFAASEGVRDPVPQTGNKLSQRRAAVGTSSKTHAHLHALYMCFSLTALWTYQHVIHMCFRIRSTLRRSTRTFTQSWVSSKLKLTVTLTSWGRNLWLLQKLLGN